MKWIYLLLRETQYFSSSSPHCSSFWYKPTASFSWYTCIVFPISLTFRIISCKQAIRKSLRAPFLVMRLSSDCVVLINWNLHRNPRLYISICSLIGTTTWWSWPILSKANVQPALHSSYLISPDDSSIPCLTIGLWDFISLAHCSHYSLVISPCRNHWEWLIGQCNSIHIPPSPKLTIDLPPMVTRPPSCV